MCTIENKSITRDLTVFKVLCRRLVVNTLVITPTLLLLYVYILLHRHLYRTYGFVRISIFSSLHTEPDESKLKPCIEIRVNRGTPQWHSIGIKIRSCPKPTVVESNGR